MVTRISGLASGMDIDSMVKQMLSVDRIKVDKVSQNKQRLEWKQQAYNGLNKELANFLIEARKDFGLMKTTSTGTNINTGLSSIGWHKTATSSDDTKLTATISGTNSFSGAHNVNVKSLAEGVAATSTVDIGNIDKNAATEGLGYSGTFKVNGKEVTVETKDTLATLAKKINSSGAGVKASYDSTLDRFFLQTDAVGASAELKIESDSSGIIADLKLGVQSTDQTSVALDVNKVYTPTSGGTVTAIATNVGLGYEGNITIVGNDPITINSTDTMEKILTKLDAAGLVASYDGTTLSLTNETGEDVTIPAELKGILGKDEETVILAGGNDSGVTVKSDALKAKLGVLDGEVYNISTGVLTLEAPIIDFTSKTEVQKNTINSLGLVVQSASVAGTLSANGSTYTGVDGQVEYNGIATSVKSNNFTFNGVSFTAKAVGEATITVGTDTEAAMDKIKGFVEEYNKIVEKMGNVIGERSNRNYQPLTEDEKEAMTEKEIELWEERAKKGLLYRDDTINKTLSNLRGSLYDKLKDASGTFSHISEIGITTEKYTSGSVGGKLAIDEDKLRAALNSDADSVLEVLFKEGEAPTGSTSGVVREDARGIFTRISDNLIDGMKGIIDRAGTGDSADLFRNVKSNLLIDFITGNNMSKQGSVSMLEKDMLNMNKQLDDLNTWLFNRENTYYSRFTAMEKAMHQASSQSGWLMQQTGGY